MSRRIDRYRAERCLGSAHRYEIYDMRQGNYSPIAIVDVSILDAVLGFLNINQRMRDDLNQLR